MQLSFCCPHCKSVIDKTEATFVCHKCGRNYPTLGLIPDFRIETNTSTDAFYEETFYDHHYKYSESDKCYYRDRDYLADKIGFLIRKTSLESFLNSCFDEKKNKLTILDAASGDGLFTQFLLNKNCEIHCLDLSRLSLNKASIFLSFEKLPSPQSIYYSQASVNSLPFYDHSFDLIICSEVIEHLEEPSVALKELWRTLKIGGKIYITTPNENGKGLFYGRLKRLTNKLNFRLKEYRSVYKIGEETEQKYKIKSHIKEFTVDELTSVLSKNGFEDISVETKYFNYLDIQMASKLLRGIDNLISNLFVVKIITFFEEKISYIFFKKKGFIQICAAIRKK